MEESDMDEEDNDSLDSEDDNLYSSGNEEGGKEAQKLRDLKDKSHV